MAEPFDIRSDVPISDTHSDSLEEFLNKLLKSEALHVKLDRWLEQRLLTKGNEGQSLVDDLFSLEELCQFDYALEGLTFEQVFRMPSMRDLSLTEAFLAVEDFLHSAAQGLWKNFWCDDGDEPMPFYVAGTHKISRFNKEPQGAALVAKCGDNSDHVSWEHILEFVLLEDDLRSMQYGKFPAPTQVSQAVFYGLHLLLSRKLAQLKSFTVTHRNADTAFILFMNSESGCIIRVKGDVGKLETNTSQVYESAAAWVQQHAHLTVSSIDKVWSRFGSVNWRDLGALQLLLATFCSMEDCLGSSKRSITEMANQHNVRLSQRIEQWRLEVGGGSGESAVRRSSQNHGEIEIEEVDQSTANVLELLKIESETVLWLEDSHGQTGFKIVENLSDGRHFAYTAIALDDEAKRFLNVYIGAHPAQLEPSWEDMSTWYQVQRQARILNVMKQRTLPSKYLPEIVHSGRLVHPGPCLKKTPQECCDHPWCGIPSLVTSPVGESLHKIFNRDGVLSSKELLECCHDCLSALQSAQSVGILHANITPDHVLRVMGADGGSHHVLVEWGHAVMEEKDSPGTSLRFSSTDVLQEGRIFPVSDIESLIYVLFYLCGGITPQFDSIESALQWRVRTWGRRAIQQVLGEASIVLKAFADYVDNLCGTPYAVDYGIWLGRLNRVLGREESGSSSQT